MKVEKGEIGMKKKIDNMVFITILLIATVVLSYGWYETLCQPIWNVWSDTPDLIEKRDVKYITVGERYFYKRSSYR